MLSPVRLALLESYTGGTIRANILDPEDNSRTLGQIVSLIRKVLNKSNNTGTQDPTILKIREKDRRNALAGRRDRSGPLPANSEPAAAASSDVVY